MTKHTAPAGLAQHPLSAAFPGMGILEFTELKEDIRQHGVINPIVLYEGHVLDGWHRYTAAAAVGAKVPASKFTGDDPVVFVRAQNYHRRHMTGGQKAVVEAELAKWATPGRPEKLPTGLVVSTEKEMAEAADVSVETIRQAKRVVEAGLSEPVKAGEISVKKAAEIAKLPEEERPAALEKAKAPKEKKPKAPKPEKDGETVECPNCSQLLEELHDALRISDAFTESERILASDDKLSQAWEEVKRLKAENHVLSERVQGLMKDKLIIQKDAKRWMKKAEAAEKKLAQIEVV